MAIGQDTSPAPIGGWNARDQISDMVEYEAITLENYFPSTSSVKLRKGYESYATGLGSNVESLMEYESGTASELFAAAGANIYDVSSSGAVGAAVVSSLTSAQFQHVMFTAGGGDYLVACNGADSVRNYNGTTWSTPSITGVTSANLIAPMVFGSRLFFIEKNTASFWYLGTGAVAGGATEFDLGPIVSRGGELMAMGTWTRDGGAGPDDMAVFVMSTGEVVIYSGTDPASASTFAKVGVFNIGAPIGRRCLLNVGSDLIVITKDGYKPLSRELPSGRTDEGISDKISGAVREAARLNSSTFGWQPIHYPNGSMALVNVPKGNSQYEQHVINTTTGAWCLFSGMDARCWSTFSDNLYFGWSGVVYKADTGTSDAGANINGDIRTAFKYHGGQSLKRYTMARPVFSADGGLPVSIGLDTDFSDRGATSAISSTAQTGAEWDTATWDVDYWAPGITPVAEWQSVSGVGRNGSLHLKTATKNQTVEFHSVDMRFETGTGI